MHSEGIGRIYNNYNYNKYLTMTQVCGMAECQGQQNIVFKIKNHIFEAQFHILTYLKFKH